MACICVALRDLYSFVRVPVCARTRFLFLDNVFGAIVECRPWMKLVFFKFGFLLRLTPRHEIKFSTGFIVKRRVN